MTRVTIVGGAYDHATRDVDLSQEVIQLLVPDPQPIPKPFDWLDVSRTAVNMRTELYRRRVICGSQPFRNAIGDQAVESYLITTFYALAELSDDEAIRQLVEGYAR